MAFFKQTRYEYWFIFPSKKRMLAFLIYNSKQYSDMYMQTVHEPFADQVQLIPGYLEVLFTYLGFQLQQRRLARNIRNVINKVSKENKENNK